MLLITSFSLLVAHQKAYAELHSENSTTKTHALVIKKPSELNFNTSEQLSLDGDNDAVLDKHDQCPNSPMGNEVDRYGCTIYTKKESNQEHTKIKPNKEKVITIPLLVNFENDKYNIDEKYFDEISRVAKYLKLNPNTSLGIEGHTSRQGDDKYNKILSQKRANAIMQLLINEFAIDSNRLSAKGFGEEKLIDLADSVEAHIINRRVEGKIFIGGDVE